MEQLQKLGLSAAIYFVITTAIALAIGISIAITVEPGNFIDSDLIRENFDIEDSGESIERAELNIHDIPQSTVGLVPNNPLASFMSGEMLSIIIFALIIEVAMITIPSQSSRPILDLLESIQKITMKVVSWAMRLAPFAAFGLMAGITSKIGISALAELGAYMATVIVGLFAMMLVYIIIIKFFAETAIFNIFYDEKSSTPCIFHLKFCCSNACFHQNCREKMKVKPRVSQFIIPLGATINMDGTAMYQIIAVFFLAQIFNVDLGFTIIILIALISLAASIGAPSAPGTGIVILATILIAAGSTICWSRIVTWS